MSEVYAAELARFAAFVDMCRAKGVLRAECGGMSLEMGPPPLVKPDGRTSEVADTVTREREAAERKRRADARAEEELFAATEGWSEDVDAEPAH